MKSRLFDIADKSTYTRQFHKGLHQINAINLLDSIRLGSRAFFGNGSDLVIQQVAHFLKRNDSE